MENLFEAIRTATTPDASPEARAAGIEACRMILSALEAASGQAMVATQSQPSSPIATIVGALRGVPPDQLLDMAIAKLTAALPAGTNVPRAQPLKFHIIPVPRRG